jgi:hypothetical protein
MSGSPTRFTNGITQAQSYQPLGQIGVPDPFFYCYYEDDFVPYNSALYTATAGGGSIAQESGGTANVGGRVLLTSGTTAGTATSLQTTAASFQYTAGKKLFYLARIQVATIANTSFIVGLIDTTATPGTVTDGIWFTYTDGATAIVLNVTTGSTSIGTLSIPIPPVNATDIDLGFYVDRKGNIVAFVGNALEGNKVNQYSYTGLGPVGKLYAQTNSVGNNTPALTGSITTALLNPTIAVVPSTTTPVTLQCDFQTAGFER